jgi:hypothetical protein
MGQMSKCKGRATTIVKAGNDLYVTYHDTTVVKVRKGIITLDTGGYRTVTTKARMNQASRQFLLGYNVYQKDFDWFLVVKGDREVRKFDKSSISFAKPEAWVKEG